MKRFFTAFLSVLMALCVSIQCFAWGDVSVDTAPVRSNNADSRLLVLMAVALAVLLVSIGTTISLRKQYLSEEAEKNKDKETDAKKSKKKKNKR